MGVFLQFASWERCLKRFATGVSLYKLNLVKRSPEWLDAIFNHVREGWIVFESRRRVEKIFGVTREKAFKIVDVSIDVKMKAYDEGKSVRRITPNWNDRGM